MTDFTTLEDQHAGTHLSESIDESLKRVTDLDIGITGTAKADVFDSLTTEVRRNTLVTASADPLKLPSNRVLMAGSRRLTATERKQGNAIHGSENSNLHDSQFPPASTGLKWVHSSPPEDTNLLFGWKQGIRKLATESPSSLVLIPDGRFRRAWDVSQAVILLYVAVMVPYRVAFNQPAMGVMFCLELLQDLFFYVDIGLNFFTGYYDSANKVVTNLLSVQRNYITTWLAIDIIACLPIDLTHRIVANKFWCSLRMSGCTSDVDSSIQLIRMIKLLRIFKLLKLLRLIRVGRILDRYQDDVMSWAHAFALMRLTFLTFIVGHFTGCAYYYMSTEDFSSRNEHELSSWFDDHSWNDDGEPDLVERYIAALYWAFQTVTTVGYGDLSATTKAERLIAIFGMLIGGFTFSYVISNMFAALHPESHERMQKEKMELVSAYLRLHRLPKDLSRSIVQFYRQQNLEFAGERQVLFGIPRDLRIQVVNHIYKGVIQSVPLFKDAGTVFATEVCARLFPLYMPQGSMVYEKDEFSNSLYILLEGKVEVTTEIDCTEEELKSSQEQKLRSLLSLRSLSFRDGSVSENVDSVMAESCVMYTKGSYFGEGCIFGWQRRTETVHFSNNSGRLLVLKGDEFISIAADYPLVLEKVAMVYIERLRRCGNLEAYDAAIVRYKEICTYFDDKDSALSAIHHSASHEDLPDIETNKESRPGLQQDAPSHTMDGAQVEVDEREQTVSQKDTRNWVRSETESDAHNKVSEVYKKKAEGRESRRLEGEDRSDQPHACRKCNQTMAEMTEMKHQLAEIREMILELGSKNANTIPAGTLNSQSSMKWAQWEDYIANNQQIIQRGLSGSSTNDRRKRSKSQEHINLMDRL